MQTDRTAPRISGRVSVGCAQARGIGSAGLRSLPAGLGVPVWERPPLG